MLVKEKKEKFKILGKDLENRWIISIDEQTLEEIEDFFLGKIMEESKKNDNHKNMSGDEFLKWLDNSNESNS